MNSSIRERFISLVARHFVRTFLLNDRRTDTSNQAPVGMVSVCRSGQKTFDIPKTWLEELEERMDTLLALDPEKAEDLLLMDFKEAIGTASDVVLTIWSALRSHWGFDQILLEYDREDSNLPMLVDSALWYVPMCGKEQQFIPYLKYQLAYLFAKGENQDELPVRPGWMAHKDGWILVGQLGRAVIRRSMGEKRSSQEWRNTILHGIKKGLPQMGPFHLLKNIKAMKDRLTRKSRTPSCLRDEIARTAGEVVRKKLLFDEWRGGDMFTKISDHACFEFSRSSRGPLGLLRTIDTRFRDQDLSSSADSKLMGFDQLLCMGFDPHEGSVMELRIPSWTPEHIYNELQRYSIFGPTGLDIASSVYPNLTGSNKEAGCWIGPIGLTGKARVKPIFEPLKVRMISAGDILSNGLFSKLQQALWGRLQRYPQFSLTGKPVKSEDIQRIHRETCEHPVLKDLHFTKWVSGDYSAATDNLNGDSSRAAVDAVSGDPITRKVLGRGLFETLITFDSIKETFEKEGDFASAEEVPEDFEMTNGQLMGCVFSFPILCIINLAVYRASLEAYTGHKFKISELPVLVNGDDILFKTNQDHLAIWEGLLPKVGFEKSVGKNYVSDKFCVINSQYFDTNSFKKVPYFNLGWCTGVTKGSGGRFEAGEDGEEKSILGLRAKVDRTEADWLYDPDFAEGLSLDAVTKRSTQVSRFKEEILRWNFDRIMKTAVSVGPGPAGLNLTPLRKNEDLAWSYYLALHRKDRPTTHGLDTHPRTMVPWKVVKVDAEPDSFWDVHRDFKRFLRRKTTETALEMLMNEYIEKSFERINSELLWKPRYSLGTY